MNNEEPKYTMLIVDDEPVISDGLKTLFDEEFPGVFKLYNCYHPIKAIEMFRFRLPDIVVSDIKMPKMTGLVMAEKMREIKPDVHILFLSGYDEFDYVYSAMKQDADDYILKTEGDGIIVEALQKMLDVMEKEHLFQEEYHHIRSKVNVMEPVFKQQALTNLLEGKISGLQEFEEMMSELRYPVLADKRLMLLVGKLNQKISQSEQESILEMVEQIVLKDYGDRIDAIHKLAYQESCVWMLQTNQEGLVKALFVTGLEIQKLILKQLQVLISFALSEAPVPWEELSKKYHLLYGEIIKMDTENGDSIFVENERKNESAVFNGEDEDFLKSLESMHEKLSVMEGLLSADNFEEFKLFLSKLLAPLSKAGRHSLYALELYNGVANMLISYINKTNIRTELATGVRLMELFDPGSFKRWEEGVDYIKGLVEKIEEIRKKSYQNTVTSIQEKTKAYILEHLSEDLSLTAIGQAVGFNPVYLSRVFKEIESISIRDYIETCRMDLAMHLLRNSRMKIYEVAEKCGYTNTAYFIKVFKAHFGKTPQEYRL